MFRIKTFLDYWSDLKKFEGAKMAQICFICRQSSETEILEFFHPFVCQAYGSWILKRFIGRIWKSLGVKNGTNMLYVHAKFGDRKIWSFLSVCLSRLRSMNTVQKSCHCWCYIVAVYWLILMQFLIVLEDETAFQTPCKLWNFVARWRHKCRWIWTRFWFFLVQCYAPFRVNDFDPIALRYKKIPKSYLGHIIE